MSPDLDTDSPDFSPEEAAAAIAVENTDGVIDHLRGRDCPECECTSYPTLQEQRRRAGVLYWRVFVACPRMHEELLVFKVRSHQPSK